MDVFTIRLNIEHYRNMLRVERDPDKRQSVSRLLAEEQSKLAATGHGRMADKDADEDVSHLNLEYYRNRLETETDLVIRQILLRLIAEEEGRMAPSDAQKASREG